MKSNQGAARLTRILTSHIDSRIPSEMWLEFGNVVTTANGLGLTVDGRENVTYPPGAWFVTEMLTAPDPIETLTDAQGGTINLTRPKILHPLQAGDRVLVALLHGGLDPVVICRVTGVGAITQ